MAALIAPISIFFRRKIYLYSFNLRSPALIGAIRSSSSSEEREALEEKRKALEKKKREAAIKRILVKTPDDKLSAMTLLEAQKLATRRDLKLLKVKDEKIKSGIDTYQLISEKQLYHKEKSAVKTNAPKLFTIKKRINDNDLETKVKQMKKLLAKDTEVQVIISEDGAVKDQAEDIYRKIEQSLGPSGRIVQKRLKHNDLRFQVLPPKKEKAEKDSDESDKNNILVE